MAARKNSFFQIGPFAESGKNIQSFIESIYAMGLYQQTIEQLEQIKQEYENAPDDETAKKLRDKITFVEEMLGIANKTLADSFSDDLNLEN
jgi:hypothetical protein|tara:strand:- start:457 stop:729 length:273 start_codon:yes stop_codon:yes gene_type:complete